MKLFGITGYKNAGKTGLMERLVTEITARGHRVSTLKHAHHTFDVDQPGKDSFRHRTAGAEQVLLSSRARWALMTEMRGAEEPALAAQIARLSPVDLVLVEGYKRDRHPKIEAFRAETGNPLIAPDDLSIRAVAADCPLELDRPVFDLNDTSAIADFILAQTGLTTTPVKSALAPPPLSNDCFALPQGAHWTPVDEALTHLATSLHAITETEQTPVAQASGRTLALDALAQRSNPPAPNSAVDGYAFAHASTTNGPQTLPLVTGRAAAGQAYPHAVPSGHAIRILTGAILPEGVDTVVLQEDVTTDDTSVAFNGPIRKGSNARDAGEDVRAGTTIAPKSRVLTPADIALLTATGLETVTTYRPLRVAILSTGDELRAPGAPAGPSQIYDANRPMLAATLARWGYEVVDLGAQPDDPTAITTAFDTGAKTADVILTSGGASAGDEDHVSALLTEKGAMQLWRIAIKPGRPLALGLWNGTPVIGLPGNPVAALVCTLIFARPALAQLAGGTFTPPQGFDLPAAFSKRKKPGRREYLRARIRKGQVEVFASEGSGRISGLSWAEGLVELPDGAAEITPGTPVHYIPYASFGL